MELPTTVIGLKFDLASIPNLPVAPLRLKVEEKRFQRGSAKLPEFECQDAHLEATLPINAEGKGCFRNQLWFRVTRGRIGNPDTVISLLETNDILMPWRLSEDYELPVFAGCLKRR